MLHAGSVCGVKTICFLTSVDFIQGNCLVLHCAYPTAHNLKVCPVWFIDLFDHSCNFLTEMLKWKLDNWCVTWKAFEIAQFNSKCCHSLLAAMLGFFNSAPTWRRHIKLEHFVWYILLNNSCTGYCTPHRNFDALFTCTLYINNVSFSWLDLLLT